MKKNKSIHMVWKPNKKERDYERISFQVEATGDLIFIWGGGMECCISPRIANLVFNRLKKAGFIK